MRLGAELGSLEIVLNKVLELRLGIELGTEFGTASTVDVLCGSDAPQVDWN